MEIISIFVMCLQKSINIAEEALEQDMLQPS
jgi:hypothetical protein